VDAVGIFESAFAEENDLKLWIDGEGGTETGKSSAEDEDIGKKVRMPLRMKRNEITHGVIVT
jgi:hypothetical protein